MSWKSTPTDKSSQIGEALSNRQLTRALEKHLPANVFGGVWARNHLDILRPTSYPKAYVINTDDEDQPGRHWTVFVCEGPDHITFFDFYGCPPDVYGEAFRRFVQDLQLHYQPRWIQGLESVVCGHYCLYYLCHRFHVPSPHALSVFGHVYRVNDILVEQWARDHFPDLQKDQKKGQRCRCFFAL
ncbi:hypothetical protein SNE40_006876 [Patella caerulea]|uniref:Uncharacterized protein n=1 Tax=Patella caerulea TaxID=87958 RepID=A0AAN8Q738_PATCE